jgi:class 3 adenylate cyclase
MAAFATRSSRTSKSAHSSTAFIAKTEPDTNASNEPNPSSATFLFADIAGFTALTEAHGDEEAAKLVVRFCDAVEAELPAYRGTQVKTIGHAYPLRPPTARYS